ncbi:MAG: RcpC/CpaB family pilus assembly protein [Anaerorhabdus sp.]
MKNKSKKILTTILLSSLLSFIILFSYYGIKNEIESTVLMPVVARIIPSRSQITADDIVLVQVPKYVVFDNVVKSKEELVGMYVKPYHTLVENSLIYYDSVSSGEKMNDVALFSLAEGEVAINIDVDIVSSYANSILVGHEIDLHYLGSARYNDSFDKTILQGEIVKDARVLSVKDQNGESIEGDSELKTSVIVVALSKENAHLVEVAKAQGEVYPIITYENFNDNSTSEYYDTNKIRDILLGNSWDVVAEPLEGKNDEPD